MMKEELVISEKKKLAQTRSKLEKKQKLINEKERKIKVKKLIKLGELISTAGLAELGDEILLGAFLEIKEFSAEKEKLKSWSERRSAWKNLSLHQRLIVNFKGNLPENMIQVLTQTLRKSGFKWYPFRKEWYGFGKKEEIEQLLGSEYAEVIEASS